MQVVESKLEVDHVTETVGLSLEGFDLVVDALHNAVGDEMPEIVEESCLAGSQVLATFANSLIPDCMASRHHTLRNSMAPSKSFFSQKSLSCSFME